jgi:hypothetical protein
MLHAGPEATAGNWSLQQTRIMKNIICTCIVGAVLTTDFAEAGYAERCERRPGTTDCAPAMEAELHGHHQEPEIPLPTKAVGEARPPSVEFEPMLQDPWPWDEESHGLEEFEATLPG